MEKNQIEFPKKKQITVKETRYQIIFQAIHILQFVYLQPSVKVNDSCLKIKKKTNNMNLNT